MKGISIAAMASLVVGCGAGDNRVDPADLERRDLLGIAPEIAMAWDAEQRASARDVLFDRDVDVASATLIDGNVERSIAAFDIERAHGGRDAVGLVTLTPIATSDEPLSLVFVDRWNIEPARGRDKLESYAAAFGATGKLEVVESPRLAAIAGYVGPHDGKRARLVVNPVMLAAIDPVGGALGVEIVDESTASGQPATPARVNGRGDHRVDPASGDGLAESTGGNPYSFYGSVAECAAAQRNRCDSCLAGGDCKPVTSTTDGMAECNTFGANGGAGFYLICINLSLSIGAVEDCAADEASQCTQVTDVASDITKLEANRNFFDDATCSMALDSCLSSIYGAPHGSFPSPDGGVTSDPPRNTAVACGDSCSDTNGSCSFDPSCTGPTCGNSFSCDSTCSSSTDQSGCGGNCDGCKSSGGGGGNSGGGCSDSGSSSSSGNSCSGDGSSGSCGGSSSSGSSGGSCGGGSSGGDCGGGSCGGSGGSCGGGGGGGSCGGGGGGGCTVAKEEPNGLAVLAVSVGWGFLPVPLAGFIRRRAKKKAAAKAKEVQS